MGVWVGGRRGGWQERRGRWGLVSKRHASLVSVASRSPSSGTLSLTRACLGLGFALSLSGGNGGGGEVAAAAAGDSPLFLWSHQWTRKGDGDGGVAGSRRGSWYAQECRVHAGLCE
jgi:hypothetical protein